MRQEHLLLSLVRVMKAQRFIHILSQLFQTKEAIKRRDEEEPLEERNWPLHN